MANKLYSAYKGAGKASSSYKASLYDIENLGIEREASQAMYQFETEKRDKNLALIQQGIGLASDLYGGHMAKKEAAADRTSVQKRMAKKAYEGDVSWDELTDTARQSQIDKFSPNESKRTLGEILMGGEKKYTFGEGGDEFTSGQISAAALSSGENKLSELLGVSSSSSITNAKNSGDLQKIQNKIMESTNKKEEKEEDFGPKAEDNNKLSDFGQMFKDARARGDKDFTFKDKLYNTNLKKFAKGGKFTTDGPEMILVGDNPGGKEKVTVKPIKSKKKEKSEGQESLADGLGTNLKQLVSKKGTKPGSNKWMNNYIQSQKMGNESLRPLKGQLSKHNKKLFSMAEESGYFGEFFRGGWE